MKLLITGASGFVGWNAVRYFVDRGFYVQPTFHSLSHYLQNHTERVRIPVQLSVQDGDAVVEVVSRFQPDFILHAAALARPQAAHPPDVLHQVNVLGTQYIARAATSVNAHLVFLSTDFLYPSNAGLVNEESLVDASCVGYARSKLEAEEEVRLHANRWTIIRPTNMFGIGTDSSNCFTQFLDRKWEAGEEAPVFSDQIRSFLYVDDLLSAVEHIIARGSTQSQTFVCGGREALTRASFALRYATFIGVDPSLCNVVESHQLAGYIGGSS
ncbi:MAG: NAD-dependent epimerase/dehydratase family protein, partial [Candidatus Kapaibacterium sp.]